jgi:hypothetical protein
MNLCAWAHISCFLFVPMLRCSETDILCAAPLLSSSRSHLLASTRPHSGLSTLSYDRRFATPADRTAQYLKRLSSSHQRYLYRSDAYMHTSVIWDTIVHLNDLGDTLYRKETIHSSNRGKFILVSPSLTYHLALSFPLTLSSG